MSLSRDTPTEYKFSPYSNIPRNQSFDIFRRDISLLRTKSNTPNNNSRSLSYLNTPRSSTDNINTTDVDSSVIVKSCHPLQGGKWYEVIEGGKKRVYIDCYRCRYMHEPFVGSPISSNKQSPSTGDDDSIE